MNTGAPWPSADEAEARVPEIQTKLHQWATDDPDRRFSDLDNLICDPAFLVVAWRRVRSNRGARTAGVDGETAYCVTTKLGKEQFLADLRSKLKAARFSRVLRAGENAWPYRRAMEAWRGANAELNEWKPVAGASSIIRSGGELWKSVFGG